MIEKGDLTGGTLGRFVPRLAVEWDLDAPGESRRALDATLCLVDISGFTSLSERLARRGRIGAEELTEVLDRVFGAMLTLAYERGGALLKFGGDALLLMFQGDSHALQACSAAVELRAALRESARMPTSVGRVALRMSVGVHTGAVDVFRVGRSHRELVVAGPAATTTALMERVAGPGEIVVSAATRAQLPADAAPRAVGPGWLLRARRPLVRGTGPVRARAVDPGMVASAVPQALRDHLSRGAAEPEHRVGSVMFVRFGGVDALMAADGPEATAAALDEVVTLLQSAADDESVTLLGSDIDADGGKLILVAGVPYAQDDDEGRVLRVARQALDNAGRLPLQIGINRGHVFSGEVGTPFRSTFTVMGDTVNTAARLMAAARRGTILAGATVLDRSRSLFSVTPLEPLHVKGKAAPLQAYDVGVELGARAPVHHLDRPFIGRDEELSVLRAGLKALAEGVGGAIVIEGDPGVGKSRLVQEALRGDDVLVLEVRGESYGTASPYRALRDTARGLLGVERAEPDHMASQLVRGVGQLAPDLLTLLPLLGELTQLRVPPSPEVDAIEPQFRPERLADAMLYLVERHLPGALAVVVEDAQWVDEASAHLLGRMVAATAAHPWLVIAVRRPQAGGFTPERAEPLVLGPLDRDEAEQLVWTASDATPLRPHDVEAVVSRAAGNPLFLEEILQIVSETGCTDALPDSLDAVVSTQIDRLSPDGRSLLRTAAVLGRSFRIETLRHVLAGRHLSLELDGELGRFLEAEGERWRFNQAIVRDVAYEGLPYRRRRELHRRAGEATERLAGNQPEQVAELLALHYAEAHEHELAWRFARIAGDRASSAYANVEAAAHYLGALNAARRLVGITDVERKELWRGLGDVRLRLGMFDEAFDAFRRAARLVPDDPIASAELALRQARAREQSGAYTRALRGLPGMTRRLAAVDTLEADGWRARLTSFQAVIRQGQERPLEALVLAERAVDQAKRAGERRALAEAYGVMDWAHVMLGHPEQAVHGRLALELYEDLGDIGAQAVITNNLGAQAYFDGQWNEAVELYTRSRAASLRAGNAVQAAAAALNLGEILVNEGRLDDAERLLADAGRVLRASGHESAQFTDVQLGRVLMDRGRLEEAELLLTQARDNSLALGRNASALEASIHLADCRLRLGDAQGSLDLLLVVRRSARVESALYATQLATIEGNAMARLGRFEEA